MQDGFEFGATTIKGTRAKKSRVKSINPEVKRSLKAKGIPPKPLLTREERLEAREAAASRRAMAGADEILPIDVIAPGPAIEAAVAGAVAAAAPGAGLPVDANAIQILSMADTIHDFYNGYRSPDLGKNTQIVLRNIHKSVGYNMMRLGAPVQNPQEVEDYSVNDLESAIGLQNNGLIEHDTVETFQAAGAPLNIVKGKAITVGALLARADRDTLVLEDNTRLMLGKNIKYAKLTVGSKEKYRRYLSDFILKYLIGLRYADRLTYFIFDSSNKDICEIMYGNENVMGMITPQNITDSATSLVATKLHPVERKPIYYFPSHGGKPYFETTQNIFTNNRLAIRYNNLWFSSQATQYNFSQTIHNKTIAGLPEVGRIIYSADNSSGPPVNYLVDCILHSHSNRDNIRARAGSPAFANATVAGAPAGYLAEDIANYGDIFFDIKRIGDHDQVRAAVAARDAGHQVVFSTGDILCALYARLNGLPCALWTNENIVLYKGTGLRQAGGGNTTTITSMPTVILEETETRAFDLSDITVITDLCSAAASYVNTTIVADLPELNLYTLMQIYNKAVEKGTNDTLYMETIKSQIEGEFTHLSIKNVYYNESTYNTQKYVSNHITPKLQEKGNLLQYINKLTEGKDASIVRVVNTIKEELEKYAREEELTSDGNIQRFRKFLNGNPRGVLLTLAVLQDIITNTWYCSIYFIIQNLLGVNPVLPSLGGVANILGVSEKMYSNLSGGNIQRPTTNSALAHSTWSPLVSRPGNFIDNQMNHQRAVPVPVMAGGARRTRHRSTKRGRKTRRRRI